MHENKRAPARKILNDTGQAVKESGKAESSDRHWHKCFTQTADMQERKVDAIDTVVKSMSMRELVNVCEW